MKKTPKHSTPEHFCLRKMGLEPTRRYRHKILSLARLPVPILPHKALINHELTLFPRKILFSFMS